ncbi:hypothetical protein K2X05_12990 [bacterium]|nr:hypothetical protein [bacterium]
MKKIILCLLTITGCASTQQNSAFETKATEYLNQYKTACLKESGSTWKQSLCVPMIIVDPTNLKTVSTEADPEGRFEKRAGVFIGTYNGAPIYANTSVKWGGRNWSMVLWPLPDDPNKRMGLMFHEAFHSIQEELGFPMSNSMNTHLDQEEARVLIRLEWNALLRAIEDSANRMDHVRVALQMRSLRYKKYPDAQKNEESLEINEGLAEYTGFKLRGSTPTETIAVLREKIQSVPEVFSLTRSSAYYSGPLYGLLFDTKNSQWKFTDFKKRRSFGKVAEQMFNVKPRKITDSNLENYGRAAIVKFEKQRAKEIKAKIATYLERIEQQGKIELALKNPQAMFNPYGILSIDAANTIYETYEVHDDWGTLTVKDGALFKVRNNQASVVVSPPTSHDSGAAQGYGWDLKLAPGWKLVKGPSRFTLEKQ